jgi:hypothetical protein
LLLRIVDFNKRAVMTAARKPNTYKPSIVAAGRFIRPCSTGRFGMKAAVSNIYMGKRAEQVISGAIRMVAMRSRLLSMTRVAMIAGTAHA